MIRLPDRRDGFVDSVPLRVGARSGREQIPHASTEVRPAGDGIEDQRHEHETGDDELKHLS